MRLIPAKAEHAALWWQIRQEATTRRHNPLEDLSIPELARRLGDSQANLGFPWRGEYRYMVVLGGQVVGTVALHDVSPKMGYGTISYMLTEAVHGQGVGTRAVAAWIDKIFGESRLVRLMANISEDNVASWRLAERLGFVREGVFREHFLLQGQRVNQYQYGLLKSEWVSPFRS